MPITKDRTEIIGRLNDNCRLGFDKTAHIVITKACLAAFSDARPMTALLAQARLMHKLRRHEFSELDTIRDRGDFLLDDVRMFFAIDCYDAQMEYGSEDPADASRTARVLTIMLADDL